MTDRKPPVQSFKNDGIKVNLWQQENAKTGKMYVTASLDKSYRDQSGAWKRSKSFSQDDLAKLQPLLAEAQQEMGKWRDYHNEVERNPDLPNPVQQKNQQQAQQAQQQPMPQTQQNDMVAQREAVMAQASGKQQSQDYGQTQTQVQNVEYSR